MNSISDVFNEFSRSHNQRFKTSELLAFLDSKCVNGYFDRDVFQQLCEQIPGSEQTCTIQQLIVVFKKAQDILNQKIEKSQQLIDQKNIEIRAYNEKLRQSNTQINKLSVQILDGEIYYNGNGQLQISLECMSSIVYTQLAKRPKPNWNENFEFNVNEQAVLKFTLLDTELQAKRLIGGVGLLYINTFADQMVHDVYTDITNESNNNVRAKIHIVVQWIYSKNKYLQDLIDDNQLQINQLEQEINDHIYDLDIINSPFKQQLLKNNLTISTYQTQQQQPQQQQGLLISETQIDRLVQISLLLIILYLVFGLLNSLYRTLFFDFMVIFYCFLFYQKNYKLQSLLHIKIIMVMLGIALLLDIVWLAIYSTPYLGEFNIEQDHFEFGIQKYQVVLSWILLIIKIVVLIFYVHIYATYPDKQTQVYDQQWKAIFGWGSRDLNVYRNYY